MKSLFVRYQSALTLLLKIGIAAAILLWLLKHDKLDLNLVLISFKNPLLWFLAITLIILQITLEALRWKIILSTQIKGIGFREVLRVQWIGQLFSVILPGAVTGDLIKIGYVAKVHKKASKKMLLFSIFIDRLTGLSALLILSGTTTLIYHKELSTLTPLLNNVININIIFLLGSIGILCILFIGQRLQEKIKQIIPIKSIRELLELVWTFSSNKIEIIQAVFIGFATHALTITSFWIINIPFFQQKIDVKYLLTLVPIGNIAGAIPISPAGLGVGHAAYDQLFNFIGSTNGASLYNVWWVVMFLSSLLGIIPFFISRKNKPTSSLDKK